MIDNWRSPARELKVDNKTDQGGEGVDELLHLVPEIVGHLELDEHGLPRFNGHGPQGEQIMIRFHPCCLLLVGSAVLPVQFFLK